MAIQLICDNCTFINYINDISMLKCKICEADLPKIDLLQFQNISQAAERKEIIYKNYRKAVELIPESLIKSPEIYLTGNINGYSIKFLVDTGAQISVISKNIAIACNLEDLIDQSYHGKIVGVGNDKIEGRIHYCDVVFDWGILPCGFTICQNPNLIPIIGIDILNSHGIIIDFKNKQLEIGTIKIKW